MHILLASLPHLSLFLGREIFAVAIATPQISLGRKNEIWGKSDNQTMYIISESFLNDFLPAIRLLHDFFGRNAGKIGKFFIEKRIF